ncbi:MAG: hypothetical protein HY290_29085 [Planctomycetia bacterium]|nr:hypothetical protein [Planctomycetia bacterium]
MAGFALSFALPSVSVRIFGDDGTPLPGWACAYYAEVSVLEANLKAFGSMTGRGAPTDSDQLPFLLWCGAGASANHLIVLAYAATLFRRFRIAAYLATIGGLCGLTCTVVVHLFDRGSGWGPLIGCYVWCGSGIVISGLLLAAYFRQRREKRSVAALPATELNR